MAATTRSSAHCGAQDVIELPPGMTLADFTEMTDGNGVTTLTSANHRITYVCSEPPVIRECGAEEASVETSSRKPVDLRSKMPVEQPPVEQPDEPPVETAGCTSGRNAGWAACWASSRSRSRNFRRAEKVNRRPTVVHGGRGNDNSHGGDATTSSTVTTATIISREALGSDHMWGGRGNDLYHVDNAGDRIHEGHGHGHDTVKSSVSHSLGRHVEKLVLTGSEDLQGIRQPTRQRPERQLR